MKIRFLILLSSVVLVALILWGGQILINHLSSKQKKTQMEILRREDALLKKIQVRILETGYRKSRSRIQESYFPVLIVEASNISRESLAKIRLVAYFKKNGGVICRGIYDLDGLRSGEIKAAAITCSHSSGLKPSFRRLKWTQMEESISFELWLEAVDISMVVENGKIEPKIISSRFPNP